jgi:hypothetical protein
MMLLKKDVRLCFEDAFFYVFGALSTIQSISSSQQQRWHRLRTPL